MKLLFKTLTVASVFFTLISAANVFAAEFPDDYYKFRDDMYNFAKSPQQMERDFNSYVAKAKQTLKGYDLNMALARYEYIMGRCYFYAKDNENAGKHYDSGTEYAKLAMKEKETSASVLIYAENVSANCTVKPTGWVIANGAQIAGLDKKALKLNPANGAAQYMLNAQDVYAPAPFYNWKRGLENMTSLLNDKNMFLDRDDRFNVISSIGYVHMLMKNKKEAKIWFEKSLEIYPGNQYVQGLIADLGK